MKDLSLRKKLIVITYAAFLLFVVMKFDFVRGVLSNIMHILSPFLLGVVLAFILNKPMCFFERLLSKKIKKKSTVRGLSITIAFLIFLLIIVAVIWFIVPQLVVNANMFISRTGIYINRLEVWINDLSDKYNLKSVDFQMLSGQLTDIIQSVSTFVVNYIRDIVPRLITVTTNLVSVIFNLVITLVFAINLLAGKEHLLKQIAQLNHAYIPEKYSKKNEKIALIVNDIFGKYLIGQVTEACILGGLCFIGMNIFRFDYSVLISTLIAVTALIPVAGAWIGGGLSFLLLALVSPINAVMFFIYLTILQQLENNLIYPRVVGSSIGLPGIWVIFAVTVGGGLFGLAGIMVSVPTMSVIYALIGENVKQRLTKKSSKTIN
ncbi:AI-2E family transporter [[Clostridium] polysaccharolyticum]|uniref:Predicted PurR-regulated permease PerM n=1 Tax=[Clostridium] polysaccharolyticum TaxID=29364 RepID=A0A1H9YR40_9FIRM|nr:AI-2E family transporter [[Clostridium] polysaccharolyticum]SES71612.1 Predicted PurR-regulated permease PerM [[Clostridium] polysaccharolyticum]